METKDVTAERHHVVYFVLSFEQSLQQIETNNTKPIVVSLPGLLPIWVTSMIDAYDMLDKLYEGIGSSLLYSLKTTLNDEDEITLFLDERPVVTGTSTPELRATLDEIIARRQREDEGPTW